MIYHDSETNEYKVFPLKGKIRDSKGGGKERINYAFRKDHFTKIAEHGDISVSEILKNELSTEQQDRLDILNSKNFNIRGSEAREFVTTGFVFPDTELETSLDSSYIDASINYAKEQLKQAIRTVRKEKESAGTTFTYDDTELFVRTDPQTQSKISSVLKQLEKSDGDDFVDWELRPNEWTEVNLEKANIMANEVSKHVQSVFTKSKSEMQAVEACSTIDELMNLNLDWIDPTEIEPLRTVAEQSDE